MQRRRLLKALALSPCLAALAGRAAGAAGSSAALDSQPLGEGLHLISGAGGNVVLFQGTEDLSLIDSGAPEHLEALLARIDELSGGRPIRRLFNTHWHEDHSGGNEGLRARGAQIVAHENTRLWLGADFDVEWRQWSHRPRPAEALPDLTFYDSGEMDLGGTPLEYHHYPQAHTDGDLCLYFPRQKVLVAGGLLSHYRYPIADIATGGWIGGLIAANAGMLALVDDDSLLVPDRGPALRKADLQAQHDMLADVYARMKALAQEGYSGQDMLKENITAAYDARWGDPRDFLLETYRGMWAHTYDMGGFI